MIDARLARPLIAVALGAAAVVGTFIYTSGPPAPDGDSIQNYVNRASKGWDTPEETQARINQLIFELPWPGRECGNVVIQVPGTAAPRVWVEVKGG